MTSATTSRGQEWRYHNLLFAEDFMNKSTAATPEDANHSLARRIGDEPQKFWDKVLWTKVMERLKFGEKRICSWSQTYKLIWNTVYTGVHYSTHYTGNVMAWAFIASSGTGSLIFINDVTHDGSSKINSEVYRNILSDNLQKDATKLIGRSFIMKQDNDPKHSSKTTKFIRARSGRF